MKINFLLACFLAILIDNPLYACDIVDKRNTQVAGRKGVEGHCSNNGLRIDCYVKGESSGGITCDGPEGTNTGYTLKDLINDVCGCPHEGQEKIEDQLNQELE